MNYNEIDLRGLTADQQLTMSQAFPVLMRKVYVWMTLALAITGFTAYAVANSPGILQAIYTNQILFWGLIIGEFALVFGVSAAINKLSLTTATLMFILYSVINGALLSYIFLAYTASSVATVFFITAGTFAAMAIVGYTTKTDLSSMGKILFMALIGLIIATIVTYCVGFPEDQADAPPGSRCRRGRSEACSPRSPHALPRLHQPLHLSPPHLRS